MKRTDLIYNFQSKKLHHSLVLDCTLFEGGENNSEANKSDCNSSHDSLADKYKDFKMPLKNEERVGRRIGTKGSQLIRSDYGSFTFKKSDEAKPSKFVVKE